MYKVRPETNRNKLKCSLCGSMNKSVFCDLSAAEMESLDQEKNTNTYKKGQELFVEGNPSFGLYCISSGKIKLTKTTEDGKSVILRIAGAGEIIGHRSLLANSPYNATATAMDEAKVCFVSQTTINKLSDQNNNISKQLLARISEQLGMNENRLVSLAQHNLRQKLAEALFILAENYGIEDPDQGNIRLDMKLSREELSSYTGTATENTIRLISEFKKQGLISESEKQITILDFEGLLKVRSGL